MSVKLPALWTVVQHSAFGYKGDHDFERGLETRQLASLSQKHKVEHAGGVIFFSYKEAEAFTEMAMYGSDEYVDPEVLIPAAKGTFATLKVDGLAVYIPVRVVVG